MELIPAGTAPTRPLLLIDGSNLAYRSYHALPPLMDKSGFPTGAMHGFGKTFVQLMINYYPKAVAVAWEAQGGSKWRKELHPEYKAHRDEMPAELRQQMEPLRDLSEALGAINLRIDEHEADDVLATAAVAWPGEVLIYTGDRDLLQVVSEDIHVLQPKRGGQIYRLDPSTVVQDYGLRPDQIPDLIALRGDTSDNIPGVKGIGPKFAAQLLQKWGHLEQIYKHIDEVEPERFRSILAEHKEEAFRGQKLARLDKNLTLPALMPWKLDKAIARAHCQKYELLALARQLDELA